MDYTFLDNLQQEFVLPEKGILSRVLQKDDYVNVTLFGFSAGQELSAHSAPTPAVIYFLEGEAEVQLGEDKVQAQSGSFVYMPPMLTHGILAKSPLRMLLVQMKNHPVQLLYCIAIRLPQDISVRLRRVKGDDRSRVRVRHSERR